MGRRITITPKAIGILISILILVLSVAALINYDSVRYNQEERISIYIDGKESVTFAISELEQMKVVTVETEFSSQNSKDEKGVWQGVMAVELLKQAGVNKGEYNTLVFSASDGYSVAAETKEAGEILISWKKDGKLLADSDEGGDGPVRCIFIKDVFGQRNIANVIKIDCIP